MKLADVKDVQAIAKDLTDEQLHCRDFGHRWIQYRVVRSRQGFERSLYCPSCKTSRHQYVGARSGELLAANYKYQPGYIIHGLGRMHAGAKGALRLESLHRITVAGNYEMQVDGLVET